MGNQNFGPKKRVNFPADVSSRFAYDDERDAIMNSNINVNATIDSRDANNVTRITDSMRKAKSNFVTRKQAEDIQFMPVSAEDTTRFEDNPPTRMQKNMTQMPKMKKGAADPSLIWKTADVLKEVTGYIEEKPD